MLAGEIDGSLARVRVGPVAPKQTELGWLSHSPFARSEIYCGSPWGPNHEN
jgi:hypothetical protein